MPRTPIAAVPVTRAGVQANTAYTAADITNGNYFEPNKRGYILQARNVHATLARNFTIRSAPGPDGLAYADRVISVPANNSTRLVATLNERQYIQNDGTIYIDGETADIVFRYTTLP